MVLETTLTLHSSTTPIMLKDCCIWCCEFAKIIKSYQSCLQLLMSSLCWIGPNKVVHAFSVKKVIMFDFFILGHNSLLHHKITHIYILWFHKNIGHGALISCVDCSCLVLHNILVSGTSSCTTTGHPVVFSSEKGQNYEGDMWVPHDGCHMCSPWSTLMAKPIRSSSLRIKC